MHSRRAIPVALVLAWIAAFCTNRAYPDDRPDPVRADHGMVSSGEALASQVGVDVLKRGGNAVDAAVAVGFTLAVTLPEAGNLGGGGFMLVRLANGRAIVIDYRETAPAAAGRTMYLDAKGAVVSDASEVGHRAVGVPGTVAGLALALRKYGTMSWHDVLEPARKLAEDGFPVSAGLARSLRSPKPRARLDRFPESRRIFLKSGSGYEAGENFRQPDLAQTLRRLQTEGPQEFYEGQTARLILDDMAAHQGLLTRDDLKAYRPVERAPLWGTYRGYEIITMPPPSSGGIALVEMLNMLERFDVARLGPNSARRDHLLIEVMRRAFADRARLLGDTDFVPVPIQRLTSKSYAGELTRTIHLDRATPSREVENYSVGSESHQTTHYSIVDAQGNAVANTYTLNLSYGSGVTVPGAGFLLNNEMDDFTSKPGAPNAFGLIQSEANAIAPRKRPLSAMTPTIVLKDGKLFLVIGSPGGPTIITTVLQAFVNIVDHGMNLRQAIAAPRLHHQGLPDCVSYEPGAMAESVLETLKSQGHKFFERPGFLGKDAPHWGDAQGVLIDLASGQRLGCSDPRSSRGRAVGY
jgi:gamma-glutamyltranspeptidase/glutathione hydrolase